MWLFENNELNGHRISLVQACNLGRGVVSEKTHIDEDARKRASNRSDEGLIYVSQELQRPYIVPVGAEGLATLVGAISCIDKCKDPQTPPERDEEGYEDSNSIVYGVV